MLKNPIVKTINEAARETNVVYEADVVVVGGGPGGHSAAVAAARNGAKTVLVEKYGYLGGLATGGLVLRIPRMSEGKEQVVGGLCKEWIDRLKVVGGVICPSQEELGSTDEKVLARWRHVLFAVIGGKLVLTATVDPELLKCILNDMVEEAGVKLFLHSWGTQAIVDKGEVKGIIFESKSGRQAILGKVIIDCTGDGDIMASAGVEFDSQLDPELRSSKLALVWRMGNVDYKKYHKFRETDKQKYEETMAELTRATGGFSVFAQACTRNDITWCNNFISGLSATNVEHLTSVEVKTREVMRKAHDFYKKSVPGFENSFIMDTASQVGTRGSRRMIGEYVYTWQDVRSGTLFDDTIAVFFSSSSTPNAELTKGDSPRCYIPYRSLLPRKIDGLLVACRAYSSDVAANNRFNNIPSCAAYGQAAGTAAAIAAKTGTKPREVDYNTLQEKLLSQGVFLPGVKKAQKKA